VEKKLQQAELAQLFTKQGPKTWDHWPNNQAGNGDERPQKKHEAWPKDAYRRARTKRDLAKRARPVKTSSRSRVPRTSARDRGAIPGRVCADAASAAAARGGRAPACIGCSVSCGGRRRSACALRLRSLRYRLAVPFALREADRMRASSPPMLRTEAICQRRRGRTDQRSRTRLGAPIRHASRSPGGGKLK
jgi:hypothetical protein